MPTVLLVEDDENDVYFFNRRIKQSGLPFQVHRAADGRAAIEFLRSAKASHSLPQAVFLDLKLPVMNGFDVLAWMQKQKFPVPVPAIVLSGSDQQRDMDRAGQLGATDYIVKPIRVADLERFLGGIHADSPASAPRGTGAKP
jgi:CheY-like chemotaxis protein